MKERVFTHTSVMPGTAAQLAAVHALPQTFSRLAMPPIIMQVIDDRRSSLTQGEIAFRLWLGPLPLPWLARHEAGETPESFKDVQVEGPLQHWVHEHIFEDVAEGVRLTDRIHFSHKSGLPGWLTRLFFDGLPLRMLFTYRHWQTRRMMKAIRSDAHTTRI